MAVVYPGDVRYAIDDDDVEALPLATLARSESLFPGDEPQ